MNNQKRIFYAIYGEFDNLNTPLPLKKLGSISDEDELTICKFPYWKGADINDIVEAFADGSFDNLTTDFLRSKGYAIPWMGLSVEEMIEANWIKLQP